MKYNRFMGEYNENTTYEKEDVVTFDGAAYYRKMPGSGISPIARKKPYTVWSRLNEDLSTIFPLGGGGTGTGLPSGGEPYMQLVTDGEGKAGWEQRLAYPETIYKVLFDGTVTTVDRWNETRNEPISFSVYDYKEYKVVYDGKEYVVPLEFDDYETGYIGSISLWSNKEYNPSEPPFCYANGWFGAAEDGEHTVVISTPVEKANPIDTKYTIGNLIIEPGVTTRADIAAYDGKYTELHVNDVYKALNNYVSFGSGYCSFDCIKWSEHGYIQVTIKATFDENDVVSDLMKTARSGIIMQGEDGNKYRVYINSDGALTVTPYDYAL